MSHRGKPGRELASWGGGGGGGMWSLHFTVLCESHECVLVRGLLSDYVKVTSACNLP